MVHILLFLHLVTHSKNFHLIIFQTCSPLRNIIQFLFILYFGSLALWCLRSIRFRESALQEESTGVPSFDSWLLFALWSFNIFSETFLCSLVKPWDRLFFVCICCFYELVWVLFLEVLSSENISAMKKNILIDIQICKVFFNFFIGEFFVFPFHVPAPGFPGVYGRSFLPSTVRLFIKIAHQTNKYKL